MVNPTFSKELPCIIRPLVEAPQEASMSVTQSLSLVHLLFLSQFSLFSSTVKMTVVKMTVVKMTVVKMAVVKMTVVKMIVVRTTVVRVQTTVVQTTVS